MKICAISIDEQQSRNDIGSWSSEDFIGDKTSKNFESPRFSLGDGTNVIIQASITEGTNNINLNVLENDQGILSCYLYLKENHNSLVMIKSSSNFWLEITLVSDS